MSSRFPTTALAATAAVVLSAGHAASQTAGMAWRADLDAARTEAADAGKLVLIHFWTDSCGPCKRLDNNVFAQPQVATAVATNYVPVKVNAQQQRDLAQALGVTRVPTDVVVTPRGDVVKAFTSPANPMEYVGYVSRLAAAYRSRAGSTFAAAAAAAPDPIAQQGQTAVPQTTSDVANRYAALLNAPAPRPSSAAMPPVATAAPTPKVEVNRYAVTPETPAATTGPAPTEPAPAQPAPETESVAPPAGQIANADTIKLPPGSPPLGFDGFCPVTMKGEWRWAKGDTKWGAIFDGRTYLFVSQDAQKTFLANPAAYSPVLAGADPVAAVDERRTVAGARRFAVEYEGRFYLFADERTLERFWSDPDGYAQGVQRVAAAMRTGGDTVIR
ncbi:MAG: thioredoxin family protein [Planctomycetota bacterium]